MAQIRPSELPAASSVNPASAIIVDSGSAVEKATPLQVVDSAIPLASQAEAEAGVNNAKRVSPLRVAQAISALGVSASTLAASAGSSLVGFLQAGTGAVARTAQDKMRETVSVFDFMTTVQIAAVQAGTSTNDTAAFTSAIASSAKTILVPAGTYRVASPTFAAGKRLVGEGPGRTVLKIVAASTSKIIDLSTFDGVEIRDLTIDGSDADNDNNVGIYLTGSDDCGLYNLEIIETGGSGIWAINSARLRGDNIILRDFTDQNAWGIHIQGNSCAGTLLTNIRTRNMKPRSVMVRNTRDVQVHNLTCDDNFTTALWFRNAPNCLGTNVVDTNDEIGDSVVIEAGCEGTWIIGVTGKNCGGHGASIAGDLIADSEGYREAPVNCHIADCWFENQGECIGAISGQTATVQIVNCSITNIHGKNCGFGNDGGSTPVPSPAFSIVSGTGCKIQGSVTDTDGNMTWAVSEEGGEAGSSNNTFIIDNWLAGTDGTARLADTSSIIQMPRLDNRMERKGNEDFVWDPTIHGRRVLFDTADIAGGDKSFTISAVYNNLEVYVGRGAGASNLLVKNPGGSTVATLAANTWAYVKYDGTNLVITERGSR